MLRGERLLGDRRDVVLKRNRGGPEIGAMFAQPPGPFSAHVGQLVDVVVHGRCAFVNDKLLGLHLAQQRVDDAERQADMVADLPADRVSARQQQLENQAFHGAGRHAGFGDRARFDRNEGVLGGLFLNGRLHAGRRIGLGVVAVGRVADALEQLIELFVLSARLLAVDRSVSRLGRGNSSPEVFSRQAALARQTRQ